MEEHVCILAAGLTDNFAASSVVMLNAAHGILSPHPADTPSAVFLIPPAGATNGSRPPLVPGCNPLAPEKSCILSTLRVLLCGPFFLHQGSDRGAARDPRLPHRDRLLPLPRTPTLSIVSTARAAWLQYRGALARAGVGSRSSAPAQPSTSCWSSWPPVTSCCWRSLRRWSSACKPRPTRSRRWRLTRPRDWYLPPTTRRVPATTTRSTRR